MNEWLPILKMSVPFLVLFGLSEYMYRIEKFPAETTRKVVHIGTGLLTLLFPVVFEHLWQVIIICTAFLLLLVLSMRYELLPSVNAVQRKTWGSVLFPVTVVLLFAFFELMEQTTPLNGLIFFYLPLLIMAIADPMAAFAGNYYKKRKGVITGNKTIIGTLSFFITAFLVASVIILDFTIIPFDKVILYSGAISLATTIAERLSSKGWDNITIPLTAAGLLYLIV